MITNKFTTEVCVNSVPRKGVQVDIVLHNG